MIAERSMKEITCTKGVDGFNLWNRQKINLIVSLHQNWICSPGDGLMGN